jgi:hypothetical protein
MAMDLSAAEDSLMVRAGFGVMLALLCGAISFLYLHNRSAVRESASLLINIAVLEHLDRILDAADRVRVDQQAFLVTGDDQLSDEVVERTMTLQHDVTALDRLTSANEFQHRAVVRLERDVQGLLDSLRQCCEVSRLPGTRTSSGALDATAEVQEVQLEATQLRRNAEIGILDVVRKRHRSGSIFDALF